MAGLVGAGQLLARHRARVVNRQRATSPAHRMEARSIAVDDEGIYFMGRYDAHYGAFRLPQRADRVLALHRIGSPTAST